MGLLGGTSAKEAAADEVGLSQTMQNLGLTSPILETLAEGSTSPAAPSPLGNVMSAATGRGATENTINMIATGPTSNQGDPTTGNYGGAEGGSTGTGVGSSAPGSPGVGGLGGETGATGQGEGGDGGGGGGTVVCTELHRQGLMSDEIYEKDVLYGSTLDDHARDGYLVWGKPLAALMAKSRLLTTIVKYPALKWANHMAGSPNWFGYVALRVGIPMCRMISRLKCLKLATNQFRRQSRPVESRGL